MDPKPKQNPKSRQPLDWGALRQEFLETTESVAEFARRKDIGNARLQDRASRGKWVESRDRIVRAALARADKKLETKMAGKWESHLKLWGGIDSIVARAMMKINQAAQNGDPISAAEVRQLAGALKDSTIVQRLLKGESTENVDQRSISLTLVDIVEKVEKGEV